MSIGLFVSNSVDYRGLLVFLVFRVFAWEIGQFVDGRVTGVKNGVVLREVNFSFL